ncbi:taste receptor type 2 member 4-like [Mantella aurantiaca]
MAASTDTTYNTQYLNSVAPAVTFFLAGLISHSFIVVVNIIDRLNGKPMTAMEKIITSLGILRLLFQFVCMTDIWLFFLAKKNLPFYILQVCFDFIEFSTYFSNIWLLTLLSLTLCIKISNFQQSLFLHLKDLIARRINYMIIGSVLVSITKALTITSIIHFVGFNASSIALMKNTTYRHDAIVGYIFILPFSNIIPFLIHLMSSALIIVTLYYHLLRMKGCKNQISQLHPIYTVIKETSYSLASYGLQVLVDIVVLCYLHLLEPIWPYVIWTGFQGAHSVFLIFAIAKLRNKLFGILRRATNFLCPKGICGSSAKDVIEAINGE